MLSFKCTLIAFPFLASATLIVSPPPLFQSFCQILKELTSATQELRNSDWSDCILVDDSALCKCRPGSVLSSYPGQCQPNTQHVIVNHQGYATFAVGFPKADVGDSLTVPECVATLHWPDRKSVV